MRLPALVQNRVSCAGMAIATAMATLFFGLLLLELLGYLTNPYLGLLLFVAIPTLFVCGLLLIPLGAWWAARQRRLHPDAAADWAVFDLRQPHQQRLLLAIAALTIVNLLIVSIAAYGGVHYMESAEFCGTTCHTTMEPEYTAYQVWPHARVACVQCHVGPGGEALVESKVAGTRQLLLVATGRVPTPVPSPIESMRPARDTCAQCHWPEKFHGDKLRLIRDYADDETNSETVTRLQVHVGGGSRSQGVGTGIHWHMNLDNQVDYIATDAKRETIPYVRVTDRSGAVREYMTKGFGPEQIAAGTARRMDCMDCHNRPAHTFFATPSRAVDAAIATSLIPRDLPFVRREAVAAVSAAFPTRSAAFEGIAGRLRQFYRARGEARTALVDRSVAATQDVWARNVFPDMKVTWGTYPSFIGHVDAPGCFRCHDDSHMSKDGRVISQDCELCHTLPE